jgi:hypothetical protein
VFFRKNDVSKAKMQETFQGLKGSFQVLKGFLFFAVATCMFAANST